MFRSDLDARAVPPNLWRLLAPLKWDDSDDFGEPGEFGAFEVPAGTITDLASIPRLLRRSKSFDPTGPSRRPAVGHDHAYQTGRLGGAPVTRAQADRFLYVALLAEGVPKATAWAFYAGVRVGGWMAWRDYRTAERDTEASGV